MRTCSFSACLGFSRSKKPSSEELGTAHAAALRALLKLVPDALDAHEELDHKDGDTLEGIIAQISALTLENDRKDSKEETKSAALYHTIFDPSSHRILHEQIETAMTKITGDPVPAVTTLLEKYENTGVDAQQQLVQVIECIFAVACEHRLEVITPESVADMINVSFRKDIVNLFVLTNNHKASDLTIKTLWNVFSRTTRPKGFNFFTLGVYNCTALIKLGVIRIDNCDREKQTILHKQISIDMLKKLLTIMRDNKEADVNVKDEKDNTPLHFAAERYRSTIESSQSYMNRPGVTERQIQRDLEFLYLLIQAGGDLDARNRDGQTPRSLITRALIHGDTER